MVKPVLATNSAPAVLTFNRHTSHMKVLFRVRSTEKDKSNPGRFDLTSERFTQQPVTIDNGLSVFLLFPAVPDHVT